MKAIIGLGNPDTKYENTRHNIGFLFVDWLFSQKGVDTKWQQKFSGLVTELTLENEKWILLKPQTYMNRSGTSVRKLVDFYKLLPEDITIVSDDVDMEFGKVRERSTGSAGGHNGLTDIFHHLGTTDIRRVKVGIGRHEHMETADWVLSKLTDEELDTLRDDIFPKVATIIAG